MVRQIQLRGPIKKGWGFLFFMAKSGIPFQNEVSWPDYCLLLNIKMYLTLQAPIKIIFIVVVIISTGVAAS